MGERARPRFWQRRHFAFRLYGILGAGLALAVALLAWLIFRRALVSFLVGINAVTFVLYGWDKLMARRSWLRVPEKLLLLFALVGASPSALASGWLFRHKTSKASFRWRLLGILAVHTALVLVLVALDWW